MKILTKLEENVLLTILKLKDNAYIVTIKDSLEDFTGKAISFGALYVSLNRLIRYGYLKNFLGESTSTQGGRAKKYYRLTNEGIEALKEIQKLQSVMWEDFSTLADEMKEVE
ncbi:MAG: PadR family transcriptional regulator [bacterium]|nr:PadR family transcriptional regulator [bacterium]